MKTISIGFVATCLFAATAAGQSLEQSPGTWVKRSPLPGAPVSPSSGYEASFGYDPARKLVVRWGGHNQGGGGEQNAETWLLDPLTAKWKLVEPNRSPPGVCCAQQNVFDPSVGRFVRFPAFSGSHGWQWFREIYLNNSSAWTFDPGTEVWRDMRPVPSPRPSPLRCASFDEEHQVTVIFGGEGNSEGTVVYDAHTNTFTRLNPKVQPAFRSAGNMTYDRDRGKHILFGAQFTDDPHTWEFDLRTNTWTDRKPEVQPPTNSNDAVLAYDPAGKVVVCNVNVVDKKNKDGETVGHYETWLYDPSANTWTKANAAREPDGHGNRRRIMVALPDLGAVLMENYVNPTQKVPGVSREQQIWTWRSKPAAVEAAPRPQAPEGVRASVQTDGSVRLTWRQIAGATEYEVSRGSGTPHWSAEMKAIARVAGTQAEFHDRTASPATAYVYAIRASKGKVQGRSTTVRTLPKLVEDVTVAVANAKRVTVAWPKATDAAGYHVERAVMQVFSDDQVIRLKKDTQPLAQPSVGAIRAIGPFTRLTKEPVAGTEFVDESIDLGKPATIEGDALLTHRFRDDQIDAKGKPYGRAVYVYRVRAVSAAGVVGGDGPYAPTFPAAVQHVFAKEDGVACRLKWAVEPGMKYRVYKIEGPKINGAGQKVTRLTPEPIDGAEFVDPAAGTETQRYHVVAVDRLGQEGYPSAPVWHYRQYRKFYEPFVGPWHQ